MGNENEVKNAIVESKKLFLHDDISGITEAEEVYSLEEEFAKTKKNKAFGLYFMVLLALGVIAAAAYFFTLFVERQSQSIDIEFSEFEDINLQEILSSSQDLQTKKRLLEIDLEDLQAEMQAEIIAVKEEAANKLELLLVRDLTPSQQQAEIDDIDDWETSENAKIADEYAVQIEDLENDIAEVELEIADFDLMAMDVAERQQQIENNYQILYDLRLEELEETYQDKIDTLEDEYNRKARVLENHYDDLKELLIAKYNPEFNLEDVIVDYSSFTETSAALSALTAISNKASTFDNAHYEYHSLLESEGIIGMEDFLTLRDELYVQAAIIDRLIEIPYINSIPYTLDYLDFVSQTIVYDYEDLWYALISTIEDKNELIDHYLYALEYYSTLNRDSGYVLDTRDPDNMIVFVQQFYTIDEEGQEAIVFRGDELTVAKIMVYPTEDGHRAQLIEMVDNSTEIRPLDNILLLLQED